MGSVNLRERWLVKQATIITVLNHPGEARQEQARD